MAKKAPIKVKLSERDDIVDLLALLPINTIFTAVLYAILSQTLQSKGLLQNIAGETLDIYVIVAKDSPGLFLGALLSQVWESGVFKKQLDSLLEKGVYDQDLEKESTFWTSVAIVAGTIKEVTGL